MKQKLSKILTKTAAKLPHPPLAFFAHKIIDFVPRAESEVF
jgi:hypothetical protein